MNRGYIKIWRRIFDEGWYQKPLIAHLAIHLILKANYKEKKIIFNKSEMIIKRGEFVTGRDTLKRETGLTLQNIRTALRVLVNCQFLTIKSTNKFSIITICNYEQYQDNLDQSNQQTNQQVTSKQPASNQQVTTNNNDNKLKNDKNIIGVTQKGDITQKGDTLSPKKVTPCHPKR